VPLVADVIEPADVRAVAGEHPVALGGGEQAVEVRLRPMAPPAFPILRLRLMPKKRGPRSVVYDIVCSLVAAPATPVRPQGARQGAARLALSLASRLLNRRSSGASTIHGHTCIGEKRDCVADHPEEH